MSVDLSNDNEKIAQVWQGLLTAETFLSHSFHKSDPSTNFTFFTNFNFSLMLCFIVSVKIMSSILQKVFHTQCTMVLLTDP